MENETIDFEKKIEKAKEYLQVLMQPQITLKESLQAYEKGLKELKEAQKMLEEAELTIKRMQQS